MNFKPLPIMSQRTDFPRKPTKRRSHTRKVQGESVMNMAEARRQIVQALQLHRASMAAEHSGCYGYEEFEKRPMYSIMESMPVPQPTWSTTAPCVLRSPVAPMEELEIFEWGDGQASSYAWWLGFLKALDVNNTNNSNDSESGMVLSQCKDGLENGEALFVEASEHSSFADEWLIIPISEDGGFI